MPSVPETSVLAIASHVVYGYVGNTMAALVMQGLGCDVAALNTVQYSNHTGYGRFRGQKTSGDEIIDLYQGICENGLADFQYMLSGYAFGANAVHAISQIARDQKDRAQTRQRRFIWVLDPVMGDGGRLYVPQDVVPAYRNLLKDADLILPNQFELELLSEIKIATSYDLRDAIESLHQHHKVPHIIVTSVNLAARLGKITVVGSSSRSNGSARLFYVQVPVIDGYFSGTGDMFAALTIIGAQELLAGKVGPPIDPWNVDDNMSAAELPLAHIVARVLDSMHEVLSFTKEARDTESSAQSITREKQSGLEDAEAQRRREIKASEVRVVRCFEQLRSPRSIYQAAEFHPAQHAP